MAFLTLLCTLPLLHFCRNKVMLKEKYYVPKIFAIWLLCQIYITINGSFRFPIGFVASLLWCLNTTHNKASKLTVLKLGIFSHLLSLFSALL